MWSPPSLPQRVKERVGEADISRRLAGATGAGATGGGALTPFDGDDDEPPTMPEPNSHLPLADENFPLLLGDEIEGRRW